jgi:ankyrin repeat protein
MVDAYSALRIIREAASEEEAIIRIRAAIRRQSLVVDEQSSLGFTALHFAARCNWHAVMDILVQHGCSHATVNSWGQTALHIAARTERTYITDIKTFLRAGESGVVAESMRVLLRVGASVNVGDNQGDTPLHYAIRRPEAIRLLTAHGARHDIRNNAGMTPHELLYANCDYGDLNAEAFTLLGPETPCDAAVSTTLSAAQTLRTHRNRRCVEVLGRRYTDMSWIARPCAMMKKLIVQKDVDQSGLNLALQLAVLVDDERAVDMLISSGADVNYPRVMWMCLPRPVANVNILKTLLAAPECTLSNASEGRYPVMSATLPEHPLIQAELDHRHDIGGETANAFIALVRKQKVMPADVVRWWHIDRTCVMAHSTRGDGDWHGKTALHYAASGKCVDVVDKLLQLGVARVMVNAQDSNGDTPLHCAVRWNRASIVKTLLGHGADPNIVNASGETPLMCMPAYCDAQVFVLLTEAGADVNVKRNDGRNALFVLADLPRPLDHPKLIRMSDGFPALLMCPDIDLEERFEGKTAEEWCIHKKYIHNAVLLAVAKGRRAVANRSMITCDFLFFADARKYVTFDAPGYIVSTDAMSSDGSNDGASTLVF